MTTFKSMGGNLSSYPPGSSCYCYLHVDRVGNLQTQTIMLCP
jgi:hypothetical protein